MTLLDVRNLSVDFKTAAGPFRAVDGVDVQVNVGDVLAIVGESGSGKSVSMLALMGLLPWTASVQADKMTFDGVDLASCSAKQRRSIIGKDVSMIFQEPMSSLNPCFTIYASHSRLVSDIKFITIPLPEQNGNRAMNYIATCGFDGYFKIWDL